MLVDELSDEAVKLWCCFFSGPNNTLRFGGDHATMEITPIARNALSELLKVGAARPIEPDDSWPGREHYGSTEIDLIELALMRGGGTPDKAFKWLTDGELVTFTKKTDAAEELPRSTAHFTST